MSWGTVHVETRRSGGIEVVDDTVKTFFERGRAEVDQQADR